MSNSPLSTYTCISPNTYGYRTEPITRITIHGAVAQCTIEELGALFAEYSYRASSNYGIGRDGRVGLFVPEDKAAMTSSSKDNDERAVTIENASSPEYPNAFNPAVWSSLIELCADICFRNGKKRLVWFASRDEALSYDPAPDEMVLTFHRWFIATACPGDWAYSRMKELADAVNALLNGEPGETGNDLYRVQVGAFRSRENAERYLEEVKKAGFKDAFIAVVPNYFD